MHPNKSHQKQAYCHKGWNENLKVTVRNNKDIDC